MRSHIILAISYRFNSDTGSEPEWGRRRCAVLPSTPLCISFNNCLIVYSACVDLGQLNGYGRLTRRGGGGYAGSGVSADFAVVGASGRSVLPQTHMLPFHLIRFNRLMSALLGR